MGRRTWWCSLMLTGAGLGLITKSLHAPGPFWAWLLGGAFGMPIAVLAGAFLWGKSGEQSQRGN